MEGDFLRPLTSIDPSIAMDAAKLLQESGIDAEIIDVQSLLPFDLEGRIVKSLKKTNRVLFLDEDVPGDLLEAGVWRGGASIFMAAALRAYGDEERLVWAADSFQGLPQPDTERYPHDSDDVFARNPHLAISLAIARWLGRSS